MSLITFNDICIDSRIMEYINDKMEELSKLVKVCNLPETADIQKIDKLYKELIQMEVSNA